MPIEERAKLASEGYDDDGYSAGLYMGYKVGATEQKAIDIDNACIILCRYACPYKIDSNKCFNAKCDTWEMFRRMMEESMNQHYAKDIKFFLTWYFIKNILRMIRNIRLKK